MILVVKNFNALISEGSLFIYTACNWCLCKSNVKGVKESDYSDISILVNTGVLSFDNQCYICLTCHKSSKKILGHVSQLPIFFFFFLEEATKDISTLNILEKELIYQRLLLKK